MNHDKHSSSDKTTRLLSVEAEVPLRFALTLERLSFAEALKDERSRVETARLKVRQAIAGLSQSTRR